MVRIFIIHFLSLFTVLFFLFFYHPHPLSAESWEVDDVNYQFNRADSSYSFRGSFVSNADFDCIVSILYDFKHLHNIITRAKSITLLQQGEKWYDVCYTFKIFLFTNKSVYRKTLKLEEGKIDFKMISNEQNTNLFPQMLSSSGYYRIMSELGGYKIEYYQECIIKRTFLKDIYINKAKKESTKFMLELKEYIERTCQ